MKLIAFFMIIGCLQLHAAGHSQTVTISVEQAPLENIFSLVEKQTGYLFFYEKKMVQGVKPVSIAAKNKTVPDFLKQLLADLPLEYSIRNTTITINRKETPALPANRLLVYPEPASLLIIVKGIVTGINGTPLVGATVQRVGSNYIKETDKQGRFSILAAIGDKLKVTYVGYQTADYKVTGEEAKIMMAPAETTLEDVEVVINTGFQKVKANEMVGAVDVVTQKMLQEQVGTNILDRLRGMTPSLQFNKNITSASKRTGNPRSVLNMSVRGWSTINGPTDPLIIVDNFPYQGDIENINPNDIESIDILKDAAAAGVWGARAANGVIVINTKRGKFNQKTSISFQTSLGYTDRPRLNRLPLMSTSSFIDREIEDFKNTIYSPGGNSALTPVVQLLVDRLANRISAADSAAGIDHFKTVDSRKEWMDHIYVHPLRQQYSMNMSGGSNNIGWTVSGSYAKTRSNTREIDERITFSTRNNFKISSKLNFETGINYAFQKSKTGAPGFNTATNKKYPYLELADEAGNALPVLERFNQQVMDTLGDGLLLDASFFPLTDWKHKYAAIRQNSYSIDGRLSYVPIRDLSIQLLFQTTRQLHEREDMSEEESYFTRNLINGFSILDRTNRIVVRQVPMGDVLQLSNNEITSTSARAQAIYDRKFGKRHRINLLAGIDASQYVNRTNGEVLFGYSEDPLYHTWVSIFTINSTMPFYEGVPLSTAIFAGETIKRRKLEERLISTTVNATYTFDGRYTVYSGLKRDGANMLGINVNDRWKPTWTTGFSWSVHKEKFMKLAWINRLDFRSSIGILGNIDITKSSNATATANSGNPFPSMSIVNPPNPGLRWEKNRNINFAIDIAVLKGRVSATFNYYIKQGRDLYGNLVADYTQSGIPKVRANVSSLDGKGWELILRTENFRGKFSWSTLFKAGRTTSKVRKHLYNKQTGAGVLSGSAGNGTDLMDFTMLFPGDELYTIRALRSAGLNDKGELQFLVNGKPTTDPTLAIRDIEQNGRNASVLRYFGSSTPTLAGSINNQFFWKGFSLYCMMDFGLGFYFKKSTIMSNDATYEYHQEWERRWQKPGDELITNVPAFNKNKNSYTNHSLMDYRVVRGDNLRLANIQLNYAVPIRNSFAGMRALNLAFNASNLGIIWSANKEGLDPNARLNFMTYEYQDKSWGFTLTAEF